MGNIEVKFRGDGGTKYTGPDRRTKEEGRGTAEDRVQEQIEDAVKQAIFEKLADGEAPATQITYKYAPTDGRPADSNEFRIDIIRSARDQAAMTLAQETTVIKGEEQGEEN